VPIVLVGKRCYRAATFWALAVLGGLLGVQLLKWTLHLPRPVSIYHGAAAYGFPSGHSTMSVVLYGFLAILLARGVTGTRRWGLFSSVVVITFAIGLSRVYLGAHWLSDVLGGLFIGTSWAALLGIAYLRKPAENIPRRALGVVVALVIVFDGGWHLARCHDRDLALYAPRHVARTMQLAAWRVDGWHALPAWRIDMEGDREQPLTIQWAGAPDDLARYLKGRGWRPTPPWSPKNVLATLSPAAPIEILPVLPRFHAGRAERLRLVHSDRDRRWVLRLWPTDVHVGKQALPLFVGTIEDQQRRHVAGLISPAVDTGDYDRPLDALERTLHDRFIVRWVRRRNHLIHVYREPSRLRWRGDVLLAWKKTALSSK